LVFFFTERDGDFLASLPFFLASFFPRVEEEDERSLLFFFFLSFAGDFVFLGDGEGDAPTRMSFIGAGDS